MKHNQKIANIGQNIAKNHLIKFGYSILYENYRVKHCEIDIIANKNENIYLIEVKTVLMGKIAPEHQLSYSKKKAMRHARPLIADKMNIDQDLIFIEFIGVILDYSKKMANINHFSLIY